MINIGQRSTNTLIPNPSRLNCTVKSVGNCQRRKVPSVTAHLVLNSIPQELGIPTDYVCSRWNYGGESDHLLTGRPCDSGSTNCG